jgi:hypothetical protein
MLVGLCLSLLDILEMLLLAENQCVHFCIVLLANYFVVVDIHESNDSWNQNTELGTLLPSEYDNIMVECPLEQSIEIMLLQFVVHGPGLHPHSVFHFMGVFADRMLESILESVLVVVILDF